MIIAKITVFQIYLENVQFFKANDTTKNVLEFNFTHLMFYKFFFKNDLKWFFALFTKTAKDRTTEIAPFDLPAPGA